jgi:hypothetical protein
MSCSPVRPASTSAARLSVPRVSACCATGREPERDRQSQGLSEDQVQFWRERVLGIK